MIEYVSLNFDSDSRKAITTCSILWQPKTDNLYILIYLEKKESSMELTRTKIQNT